MCQNRARGEEKGRKYRGKEKGGQKKGEKGEMKINFLSKQKFW